MGKGVVTISKEFLEDFLVTGKKIHCEVIKSPKDMEILCVMPSMDLEKGRIKLLVESPEIKATAHGEQYPKVNIVLKDL